MGFMIRSLTCDWKYWIYFDIDMKLTNTDEWYEMIGKFAISKFGKDNSQDAHWRTF